MSEQLKRSIATKKLQRDEKRRKLVMPRTRDPSSGRTSDSSDVEQAQPVEQQPSNQTYRVKEDIYHVPAPIIVERTPPRALDFEFFVDLIFKTDQSIIRAGPHGCIFKNIEDVRVFVLSMAIYAKLVSRHRVDDLFDPMQSVKGYTFNWMISISLFYHPALRTFATARQIEGKKLMRMISAPVNDDKYRLASTVMYFLTLLYSAKRGEGHLPSRFHDGHRAFLVANSPYQNVRFFAIPFDHNEVTRMNITRDDFPKALDSKDFRNDGIGQIYEKDEMLEQVDRLVTSYNNSRAKSETFNKQLLDCQEKLNALTRKREAMKQQWQTLQTKTQLAKGMETFLGTIIAGGITTTGDFVREAARRNMSFEELGRLKYSESNINVGQLNVTLEDMVEGRETSGLQFPSKPEPTFGNCIAPEPQEHQDLQLSCSDEEETSSDSVSGRVIQLSCSDEEETRSDSVNDENSVEIVSQDAGIHRNLDTAVDNNSTLLREPEATHSQDIHEDLNRNSENSDILAEILDFDLDDL